MAFGDVIRSASAPSSTFGIGGDSSTIWHNNASSTVYELDPSDLSVVRSESSPGSGARGIGGDSSTIWHTVRYSPGENYELSTADFSVIKESSSPGAIPYGIGGDSSTVWHCDYWEDEIYELTTNLSVIRSTSAPAGPFGIGGNASTIWYCANNDVVYELATSDLSVIQQSSVPSGARGVGGDSSTIWYCSKDPNMLYEISTGVAPPSVTTQEATEISATSAVGHGEITDTGGAEVVERGFEWGTEPGDYPNSVTEEA